MPLSPAVLLTALSQCVCEALNDDDYPHLKPCFCGIIPGTTPIAEMMSNCGSSNGVAWVRLALSYQSDTVGLAVTTPSNCASGIGYDIEIGVVREHDEYYKAEVMSEEEAAEITAWQMDDMLALRRAIACCEALEQEDYILGSYTPSGPTGGIVGGAWTLHVSLI